MQSILVGLGGNLPSPVGAPETTLRAAIDMLDREKISILKTSRYYKTAPVPASEQPDFVNIALLAETSRSAKKLLSIFQGIEKRLGRKEGERWSARTLDIDLLAYGAQVLPSISAWHTVVNSPDFAAILPEPVVPHPRLHKRAFVLLPLLDVVPEWCHPIYNKTVYEMAHSDEIVCSHNSVKLFSNA